MHLDIADYAVIVGFFALNLAIGVYYARRGTGTLADYFISGRGVPWWLAGISMVATTFAADTPLVVTGFVAQHGIAGNWLWWSSVMSGILTVVFFARLWRRSGVLTDVEFIELRYGGRSAAALRLVRGVFQGVLVNTIIMGWVNLAMAKILELTLDVPRFAAMAVCLILTGIYVMIGGLWGVLVTDVLQFAVKMTMAIILAAVAVAAAGGMGSLEHHLALLDAQRGGGSILSFFPTGDQSWLPALSFLTYIAVQWWASSYPGAEPGGGGYVAQRIFSARSERDSTLATLFFNVAHYALRPWPWILVALAALVLYPHGVRGHDGKLDPELGYVQAMIDYLPPWLRGLMMAGFLAAFMSTIGTHLNLGASYLTNDLYRRFLVRDADEKHYLGASRIATLIVMGLSVCGAFALHSVGDGWKYLFNLTAGVGPVMILRWYWWRVNAWSEISALAASAIVSNTLILTNIIPSTDPNAQAKMLLVTVTLTSIVWLTTTMLTRPESPATLERFYLRVRPQRWGWRRVAVDVEDTTIGESFGLQIIDWFAGCGLVYGTLFGIGKIVLGSVLEGLGYLVLACICAAIIIPHLLAQTSPEPISSSSSNS